LSALYKVSAQSGVIEAAGATPEEALFTYRYKDRFNGFLLHAIARLGAREFRALLERNGYDGVIDYREPYPGEPPGRCISEAVAFHPAQIKSSVGNCGTFLDDPSILK
jgi:hypothetical protein